jgi:hypothetical protein
MPRVPLDIETDRWVECIRELVFLDQDFTGATITAMVRSYADAPGAPLRSLAKVTDEGIQGIVLEYAGEDTVANHIEAGRLVETPPGYQSTDTLLLSVLRIRVTAMRDTQEPDELGDTVTLYWDMHITPAGGVEDVWCGGNYIVTPGAYYA